MGTYSWTTSKIAKPGEHIVWQDSPNWRRMAQQAFHINKVALYFSVMILLDIYSTIKSGITLQSIMEGPALTLILSLSCLAILAGLCMAYRFSNNLSLTNKRILIRFGIAIQLTLDIPLNQIISANMTKSGVATAT